MKDKKKKSVSVGGVVIGGNAPVSIQSMCNTKTADVEGSVAQIKRLQEAGCEIVRMTVPDMESAEAFKKIRNRTDIPLVADIHFDYRLAIAAIDAGADKIRINPGNIGSEENVRKVAAKAKTSGIPIRVGVNGGSLEKDILSKYGRVTAEGLAESALRNVQMLKQCDFDDIIVSLKSSDVQLNYQAYKIVHERCAYPLHIGVTEAGTPAAGKIKSAAGIGALLLEGIGDTMRVSLTADPVEEVHLAKSLLHCLGIRKKSFEIISCPTCGRTEVNLEKIADAVERKMDEIDFAEGDHVKIAVMGCAVNGPGEAREADFGVACGRGEGLLFSHGKTLYKVREEEIASELAKLVCNEKNS